MGAIELAAILGATAVTAMIICWVAGPAEC